MSRRTKISILAIWLCVLAAWGLVARGEEIRTLEATAFTIPFRSSELASDSSGVVDKVHVEEGDAVQAGQLLVELKADVLKAELGISQARLESARVQLAAAQATYETRRMDFERVSKLFEKKIASQEDFDKAKLEMELAQLTVGNASAQVKMMEMSVQRDEAAVRRTQIRAPHAGIVHRILKREGEAIQMDAPLVRLVAVDPLYVIANLPLKTTGQITTQTKATLALEHTPETPLSCTVSAVDSVSDAASGSYRVKLILPNPGGKVPAGARGVVRFHLPR